MKNTKVIAALLSDKNKFDAFKVRTLENYSYIIECGQNPNLVYEGFQFDLAFKTLLEVKQLELVNLEYILDASEDVLLDHFKFVTNYVHYCRIAVLQYDSFILSNNTVKSKIDHINSILDRVTATSGEQYRVKQECLFELEVLPEFNKQNEPSINHTLDLLLEVTEDIFEDYRFRPIEYKHKAVNKEKQ